MKSMGSGWENLKIQLALKGLKVTPNIILSILISIVPSFLSSFFFNPQHSEHYVIIDRTIVVYIVAFNLMGILKLSFMTDFISLHFIQQQKHSLLPVHPFHSLLYCQSLTPGTYKMFHLFQFLSMCTSDVHMFFSILATYHHPCLFRVHF